MKRVYGLQLSSAMMTTLPVSIGTLWAYLSTKKDVYNKLELVDIFIRHEKSVLEIVDEIKDPDYILCTLYMWNRNRTNKLTKKIKDLYPNCKIIVGGNDVPQRESRLKAFASENPQYDYFVWSEGELALENIFRKELGLSHWSSGFSYYDDKKKLVIQLEKKYLPINEGLDIPSPSSMGLYDSLVKKYKDRFEIQSVLETNRGCPYSCTFCDWGLEEKLRRFSLERIRDEIDWMVENTDEMMIADANFGILKRDVEISKYIVDRKINFGGRLHSTNVTYAKANKERVLEIADIMERFDLNRAGASISLQSLNPETNKAIKREDIKTLKNLPWLVEKFKEKGLPFYNELIIGLPLETKVSFFTSLEKLLDYNPFEIHIYKLSLLENSEMSKEDHSEKYGMKWSAFVQGPSEYRDEEEITYLVKETSTMPLKDMRYVRSIRDMVQVQWFGKLTYFIMRFLKKECSFNYIDFFEKLLSKIEKNDLLSEYQRTLVDAGENKEFVPFYYTYHDNCRYHRYVNNWIYLRKNIDILYSIIFKEIVSTLRFDLKTEEKFKDLMEFNKNILIKIPIQKTNKFVTRYNWMEYFKNRKLIEGSFLWDLSISHLGTPAHPPSFKDAAYFAAGGHSYVFNKQSAFTYQRGKINGNSILIRHGDFYYENEICLGNIKRS